MFYINADPHGDYRKIENFIDRMELTKEDTIILLGDVAANYYGDDRDDARKKWLNDLGPKFFCIHGNHEMRPFNLPQYALIDYNDGKVWVDPKYPNILFAKDGEIFNLDGKKCVVLGGAYSVDKPLRLARHLGWFEDEQPSDEIKNFAEENLKKNNWTVDFVFSHTCPVSYEPRECFLPNLDQTSVDKSTEMWLGDIEYKLNYDKWYVGHYHIDKTIDKIQFLYNSFEMLPTKELVHNFDCFDER